MKKQYKSSMSSSEAMFEASSVYFQYVNAIIPIDVDLGRSKSLDFSCGKSLLQYKDEFFLYFCKMFIPRFEGLPYGFSRSYDLCSIDQCSSQLSNKCVLTVFVQLLQKFGQIHFLEKFT